MDAPVEGGDGALLRMVEHLPAAAVFLGGERLVMNRGAERLTGHPRNALRSIDAWFEALYPGRVAEVKALYLEDRAQGFPEPRVVPLRRADGEMRWVSFSGSMSDLGEFWVMHDLTERVRAEEVAARRRNELQTILDHAPMVVFMKSLTGRYLFINETYRQVLERPDLDAGMTDEQIFGPEFAAECRRTDLEVLSGGRTLRFEHHVAGRVFHETKFLIRDPEGVPFAIGGLSEDVTERMRAEQELRIAASAFAGRDAMMVTDATGTIQRVNQAFTALTGFDAQSTVGWSLALMVPAWSDRSFYRHLWDSVARQGQWHGEVTCRYADGEEHPVALSISAVTGPGGAVSHHVCTLADITDRKRAEAEIRRLAFYDALTHLPNRRLLREHLRLALATSARHGSHGALLFVDLDNFKTVNDTLGHDAGDLLLQTVAQRLTGCVREEDTVARLGGDEFVVMLGRLGSDRARAAERAEAVAEKVRVALAEPVQLAGEEHAVTASIGIALFYGHEDAEEDILKRADVAMYRAKGAGRNAVRFFDPEMQVAIEARARLEGDLRRALPRGEFEPWLQVQVDARRRPVGAEVLLRWRHPQRGLVSPAEFIPLAEEIGLIAPVGQWVLEQACALVSRWSAHPRLARLPLSVNVSARQFRARDFAARVLRTVREAGVDAALIRLELTESVLLDDVDDAVAKLLELRAGGVACSMDDFGTGYSSLAFLKQLPVAEVKIDRTFVRDLLTDPGDLKIVQAIMDIARHLELSAVAEGVESEEQFELLSGSGCPVFQGYLFGRPMPAGDFEAQS